jgi:hypothetical protein
LQFVVAAFNDVIVESAFVDRLPKNSWVWETPD